MYRKWQMSGVSECLQEGLPMRGYIRNNHCSWFTMASLLQHHSCTRLLVESHVMLDISLVPAAWLVHQSLISPLQEKNLSKSLLVTPWLFSMWWSPMSRSTCDTSIALTFRHCVLWCVKPPRQAIVMYKTSKTSNSDVWNLQDKEGKLVDLLHQLLDGEAHLLTHWYEFVAM